MAKKNIKKTRNVLFRIYRDEKGEFIQKNGKKIYLKKTRKRPPKMKIEREITQPNKRMQQLRYSQPPLLNYSNILQEMLHYQRQKDYDKEMEKKLVDKIQIIDEKLKNAKHKETQQLLLKKDSSLKKLQDLREGKKISPVSTESQLKKQMKEQSSEKSQQSTLSEQSEQKFKDLQQVSLSQQVAINKLYQKLQKQQQIYQQIPKSSKKMRESAKKKSDEIQQLIQRLEKVNVALPQQIVQKSKEILQQEIGKKSSLMPSDFQKSIPEQIEDEEEERKDHNVSFDINNKDFQNINDDDEFQKNYGEILKDSIFENLTVEEFRQKMQDHDFDCDIFLDSEMSKVVISHSEYTVILFTRNNHITVIVFNPFEHEIVHFDSQGSIRRLKQDLNLISDHIITFSPELMVKLKHNTINFQKKDPYKSGCCYFCYNFLHNYIILGEQFKQASGFQESDFDEKIEYNYI